MHQLTYFIFLFFLIFLTISSNNFDCIRENQFSDFGYLLLDCITITYFKNFMNYIFCNDFLKFHQIVKQFSKNLLNLCRFSYEGSFKSKVTLFTKPVKKDRALKQRLLDSSQNILLFYIITLQIKALTVTRKKFMDANVIPLSILFSKELTNHDLKKIPLPRYTASASLILHRIISAVVLCHHVRHPSSTHFPYFQFFSYNVKDCCVASLH